MYGLNEIVAMNAIAIQSLMGNGKHDKKRGVSMNPHRTNDPALRAEHIELLAHFKPKKAKT